MRSFQFVGLLTVASTLAIAGATLPAAAQQRVCVESDRDGRVVCGRLVSGDGYGDRYDRYGNDRYDNDRYGNDRYNDRYGSSDRCSNFDENFYLTAYPDVADAVRRGKVSSACSHYQKFGRYEGRFPSFNEASYLAKNPDVAAAVRRGQYRNGYEHWRKFGRYENRPL